MSRRGGAILAGIVLLVVVYVWVGLTAFPAAVVCDRGKPNVKVSSTAIGGYFKERHVGPCVLLTHRSHPVPDPRGGSAGGD